MANFEAVIEEKRVKRKVVFGRIWRFIVLPGIFIPLFNAIAPEAPAAVWVLSLPFLLFAWRGLRATEERPSWIARETAWVLIGLAVFGIARSLPEHQRRGEVVAGGAGHVATEQAQREKGCANVPRDPNAWEKAVADGTLSPKRDEVKFFVQRQLACHPGDEELIKKLRWMADEAARAIMEENAARNPQNYLKLTTSWRTTTVHGGVMKADFSIQNTSTIPIRDIAIVCNMKAPSGTVVSVNRQTIYDVVKGGATRSFKDVNMGFINAQASKAFCHVEGARAY